jgi:hypothetical protein
MSACHFHVGTSAHRRGRACESPGITGRSRVIPHFDFTKVPPAPEGLCRVQQHSIAEAGRSFLLQRLHRHETIVATEIIPAMLLWRKSLHVFMQRNEDRAKANIVRWGKILSSTLVSNATTGRALLAQRRPVQRAMFKSLSRRTWSAVYGAAQTIASPTPDSPHDGRRCPLPNGPSCLRSGPCPLRARGHSRAFRRGERPRRRLGHPPGS